MTNQFSAPQRSEELRSATGKAAKAGYRPEVQGLRAVAVLMVASYHIWFDRVSGGVDVFLLISAFLLSLSFIRKVEDGRPLRLGQYWIHVFKRLLPAVSVVLVGTLIATALFVPRSRWTEILSQSWSSLLYFQNWALAADSVDYYAADHSGASPLQHFWSLSVQGQVFILWPILFALSAVLARAGRKPFRRIVLYVFGTVFAVSLAFSVHETYTNQAHAYFDTRTRLWEFAFGTLLALALPYLKPGKGLRIAAGWLGLAAILSCGFLLDVQGAFPGFVALWPLVAAALVIVAGQTGSRFGADRFLSWGPLVRMGDMSYALYLWHWPVLVIYLIFRDRTSAGPLSGAAIIIVSLTLAYLTTRLVERPLRTMDWVQRSTLNGVVAIAVCAAVVAVPVFSAQTALRVQGERLLAGADRNNPGAAALDPGFFYLGDEDATVLPTADVVGGDYVSLEEGCTGRYATDAEMLQGYGCSGIVSQENPERTIVAVGNSHVQQLVAGLAPLAAERNWALIALVKGGCQLESSRETYSQECNERNEQAMEYISELKPDAVLTTATYSIAGPPYELLPGGFGSVAQDIVSQGIKLVGVRDTPRYTFDMAQCPETHGIDSAECNPPYESVRNTDFSSIQAIGSVVPEMGTIDIDDLVCPNGTCPAVIGNVRVYLDDNHLSRTYVESMAPQFAERFLKAVGW
ncbi:acyltransferase [Arthrobacter sp. zg-Y859]|uniref:Acyltransferase n=1 Tax=Arthrobacter jinronghuae TaxID=2964609 RepID=A0ABT1NP32_9MICC|nr:acyltransferase family protein [Arthrobacter jinronghuae]MCQ1949490.1 acyltransferase [Arthrobacter jinronghuae]MCQ1955069.1 acyltransferase [Arthrobacter jinronghuae]UWX77737.1 acyltransferase [Arthrobacter jinronghuae]